MNKVEKNTKTKDKPIKWSTDVINQFIKDNNIDVVLLSEYTGIYNKMFFRCKCGNIFETNLHEFNNKKYPKRQCNICGRKKPNDKNRITCSKVQEYLNNNYYSCKLLSTEYKGCDCKLEFECCCGEHFFASWSNIKQMSGFCKKCIARYLSNKRKIPDSELQKQINKIYNNEHFELLDRDIRYIHIKHSVCQKKFRIRIGHLLDGQGCKYCNIKNRDFGALTHIEFLDRVSKYRDDFEILTTYQNNHTPIKLKCKKCGNIFSQLPSYIFDRGIYCQSCNGTKGEQSIERFLRNNNINYITQYRFEDCRDIKPLPFDFYLPDFNILIEYQGIQHYKPVNYFGGDMAFQSQIRRDLIKREYCKNNHINLIEVSYKDFTNIDTILNLLIFTEEVV